MTRLEREGLTRVQAEGIIGTLEEVIEQSIDNMQRNLVTRAEQDKHHYTQKVDFSQLKTELQLSEKADFMNLKAENERLQGDIERLKQRLREEITRTQAGVVRAPPPPFVLTSISATRSQPREGPHPGRDERAGGQADRGGHPNRERDWASTDVVSFLP